MLGDQAEPGEGAGVLVARVWFEDDGRFRARVIMTTDVRAPDDITVLAGSPEELLEAVRDWLEAMSINRE